MMNQYYGVSSFSGRGGRYDYDRAPYRRPGNRSGMQGNMHGNMPGNMPVNMPGNMSGNMSGCMSNRTFGTTQGNGTCSGGNSNTPRLSGCGCGCGMNRAHQHDHRDHNDHNDHNDYNAHNDHRAHNDHHDHDRDGCNHAIPAVNHANGCGCGCGNGTDTAACKRLMDQIRAVDFALYETVLYLDVYPNSCDALETYRKLKAQSEALHAEYEATCAPLTAFGNKSDTSWDWMGKPFPWEYDAD